MRCSIARELLDFGLAKLVRPESESVADSRLTTELRTTEGTVMGTLPYMSPEQLLGQALDHRTDIFSLGVMLYEMASGERPFQGASADLAAAILRDTPRPLVERRKDLPAGLPQIIGRCLEKSAADRFSSAREVLNALHAVTTEPPPASRDAPAAQISIAVLPFSDMSAAKDQDYLCEGMAEEIMNALMRIDGIRVASRASAFRAGRSGGDLAAVFAIQDEIAAGVVDAVKARLGPRSGTVHARPQAHNLDAYRSYLKGRHLRGIEDFGGAMRAFEEAVRLAPAHGLSWTGLAEITILSAHMGMILPRGACTAARRMLATANELQGESAESLHVEAFASFLERRWKEMEIAWRRSIELEPDYVLALGSFAVTLCGRQRLDEALPLFERARQADPLASFPYMLAGWELLICGKPDDALRHIDDALTFQKDDASAIAASCMANVALGRFEDAVAAGKRGVAVGYRAPYFLGVLGLGARYGWPKRRGAACARRTPSAARGLTHRGLRSLAARRTWRDRWRVRRAGPGRRGAPRPPLLHGNAWVRFAPDRSTIRRAAAKTRAVTRVRGGVRIRATSSLRMTRAEPRRRLRAGCAGSTSTTGACVRTVRELSGNIGDRRSRSVMTTLAMCVGGNPLCSIATCGLAPGPAFNFQWSWSSGTVAGRAAANVRLV